MKPTTRLIVGLLARLAFLACAAWFAIDAGTLPGAPVLARVAVAALFLGLSVLIGEVMTLRTHLSLLLGALRATGAVGPGQRPRDDRAAIDVLVRGLSGPEPEARAKALKHLRRLTGQDLPSDPEAWTRWWAENRATFPAGGRESLD